MKPQIRLAEYLGTVFFMWSFYVIPLTLYLFYGIGLTVDQYIFWLWSGILVDLCIAYPMGKVLYHYFLPWFRRIIGIPAKCVECGR